jgi:aarF domain-containing kinase
MSTFPFPFEEDTKDSVLVETFVEGVPVTYYEKVKHPLNKVIARLGSTTFFEMLMKNNFIHADCHGGNILIEIREKSYSWYT